MMENPVNLAITLLLAIFIFCSNVVLGMDNEACHKEHLKFQMKQNLNCFVMPNITFVLSTLRIDTEVPVNHMPLKSSETSTLCSLYQQVFTEQSLCFLMPIQSCFDSKWLLFAYEHISASNKYCNGNTLTPGKSQGMLQISRNVTNDFLEVVHDNMLSIDFEKPCSYDDRALSVKQILYCSYEHFSELWLFVNLDSQTSKSSKTNSICSRIEQLLNSCFQPDRCFSDQEIVSIKKTVSEMYALYVEGLLEFSKNPGSFQKTTIQNITKRNALNITIDTEFGTKFQIREEQDGYIKLFDMAIEDYTTGRCKANLTIISPLNPPTLSYLSQKWFTIPLISLSVIFTCYLLVQCRQGRQT